ncbi:MAG: hypothetical protein J2P57_20665, partial [Acidimicrobiaceae bacterium]|nr:hypothetical protein [Acidimicrobiaceae bacterium]
MTLPVRFDPAAEDELDAAHDWYEQRNRGVGAEFVAEVRRVAQGAAEWPGIAPQVTVPDTATDVRRAGLRRFGARRAFVHAAHQLSVRLNRHLFQDSGMTEGDYPVLSVLSEVTTGRMSAQELGGLLQWEKSRLSHQLRRM